MAKSRRHKKIRKQEIHKIKLKLGKKLKKSQNETKTDFKAQKIVLREQLSKKTQSSLVTKKSLNLNELLSRLSHHSVYVRQDGLNGLKELVLKNSKNDLAPHNSSLFRGLNPCLLDTDHLIRMTAIKLIESIIIKNGSMIQTYFKPICAYLSCAMVHMNTAIQSDSLALMDTLIQYVPYLLAQQANTLLENFFSLISQKIGQQKNTSFESYVLISNPTSRLASIKWRIKLLNSLSKYLGAILSQKTKTEGSVAKSPWQVITLGCLPSLSEDPQMGGASVHGTNILTEESATKSLVARLVPLLFQTLSEVGYCARNYSKSSEVSGTLLDQCTIELFKCVSEIILHLWNITQLVTENDPLKCLWLVEILYKHMTEGVFYGFPYAVLQSNEKTMQSQKKSKNVDIECQQLNVNLTALSVLYFKRIPKLERRMIQYYIDLLSGGEMSAQIKLDKMIAACCDYFKKNKTSTRRLSEKLLSASLKCFEKASDKSRNSLLALPLQASEQTCKHLWHSKALRSWMTKLVEISVQSETLDESLVEILLQFNLRKTPGFASEMDQHKALLLEKMKLCRTKKLYSEKNYEYLYIE